MRRFFDRGVLLRAVFSLALLGFLIWRIDLREAGRAISEADYVYVLPAMAIFGIGKLLVSVRWQLMMSKFARLPLSELFGLMLVSNLANNVLPARIGDLIRVQVPAQRHDLSRARVAATVFATESLLDGIAFAGLGLIALALIDIPGFPTAVFWGMFGGLVGGLAAVVPLSHLQLSEGWECRGWLARLPHRMQHAIETSVPHFIDGLAVFRELRLAAPALALSFVIWLLEVLMFWLFGRAFGIGLSMPAWILIMVAANFVSAVPVAPSNIGAYEVALTELVVALGVDAGTAGGFAIGAHLFNIAWISVAGFIAMLALGLRLSDVFSFSPSGAQPRAAPDAVPRQPAAEAP